MEKKICQRQGFNTVIYYDRLTPIGQGTNQDKEYMSIDYNLKGIGITLSNRQPLKKIGYHGESQQPL